MSKDIAQVPKDKETIAKEAMEAWNSNTNYISLEPIVGKCVGYVKKPVRATEASESQPSLQQLVLTEMLEWKDDVEEFMDKKLPDLKKKYDEAMAKKKEQQPKKDVKAEPLPNNLMEVLRWVKDENYCVSSVNYHFQPETLELKFDTGKQLTVSSPYVGLPANCEVVTVTDSSDTGDTISSNDSKISEEVRNSTDLNYTNTSVSDVTLSGASDTTSLDMVTVVERLLDENAILASNDSGVLNDSTDANADSKMDVPGFQASVVGLFVGSLVSSCCEEDKLDKAVHEYDEYIATAMELGLNEFEANEATAAAVELEKKEFEKSKKNNNDSDV